MVVPKCGEGSRAASRVLAKRCADNPVLALVGNGTLIYLRDGVSADHIAVGRSLTVICTVQDGKKLAEGICVKPDWLLDQVGHLDR